MRALIVIHDISKKGGAERVVTLLSDALNLQRDINVEILSLSFKNGKTTGYPTNAKIKYLQNPKIKIFPFKQFSTLRQITQTIGESNYDTIICTSTYLVFLFLTARLRSLSTFDLISWEHTQRDFLPRRIRLAQRIFYPFVKAVVSLSQAEQEKFRRITRRSFFIPNIATFRNNVSKEIIVKSNIILGVGRLEHAKGFDLLIHSFKRLTEEIGGWRLVICGDGHERKKLEELTSSLDLDNLIDFMGYQSEIGSFYEQASIFALSSRSEGFPCVLVESMSYGVPSVSFALPGLNEVIENGVNGLLVKPYDKERFVDSLKSLIQTPDKRLSMGREAKKTSQRYDSDFIVEKWMKIF